MRFPRFPRIVSPTLALIVRMSQGFPASPKNPYKAAARRQLFSYQTKAAQRQVVVAPPAVGKSTTRVVRVPPELGMGYSKP